MTGANPHDRTFSRKAMKAELLDPKTETALALVVAGDGKAERERDIVCERKMRKSLEWHGADLHDLFA